MANVIKQTHSRHKKSSFYHARKRLAITDREAAELLDVTVEQLLAWDYSGAPAYAERLLLCCSKKFVGLRGWDEWYFSGNLLIFKGQRFGPETILHDRQFRNELQSESLTLLEALKKGEFVSKS